MNGMWKGLKTKKKRETVLEKEVQVDNGKGSEWERKKENETLIRQKREVWKTKNVFWKYETREREREREWLENQIKVRRKDAR